MRKEVKNQINELFRKYKTKELTEIDNNNSLINIKLYKVLLSDNTVFYREKIEKNNGFGSSSSVLPILKNGNVLLVVEPRVFTDNTVEISIPGGYIDKDEKPMDAAKRELEEETGLISDNIIEVSKYYSDMGNSDHISHVFIAFDCDAKGIIKHDSDEFMDTIEVTKEELFELVDTGFINNAATIITALKLRELEKKVS